MSENTQVTVARQRITRIIDTLSLLSIQQFDAEGMRIDVVEEDDLAMLEHTLNLFVAEFIVTHRQREESLRLLAAAQEAELKEKLTTIETQRAAIRDLSTPVIELWDDIVTLPVVGMVDATRSMEMTERLLHRIVKGHAKCAIIDITGVEVVDTMTANHFIKMVNAARLLGTYCVVTGISPLIAQTLSQIGVDLNEVKTLRSLKEGLMECFIYLRAQQSLVTSATLSAGDTLRRSTP